MTSTHRGHRSTDHRRAPVVLVCVVAAFGLVGVSCGGASSTTNNATPPPPAGGTAAPSTVIPADEGKPKDGGKLVFGVDTEPDGFDPTASQFNTTAHIIISSVVEPLAVFDGAHVPQPYLAESITPADGATRWVIKVKPNIAFSDGAPLDATAMAANMEAQRKGIGGIAMKLVDGVKVVDPRTIEVHMSKPWSTFSSMLAGQVGYELSPAVLGQPDLAKHPVGTGPFVFDHWDPGAGVVVKKNPHYWQAGKPHLDEISFKIITDPSSRATALASRDLTLMLSDVPKTISDYRANPDFTTIVDASGDAKAITLNEAVPPFDNVNARRALVLATDSEALTQTIGDGVLQPIDQPFGAGPYHAADAHYPKHDLDAAKKAVAQYTAETGQPLTFTFTTYIDSASQEQAQLLQAQWAEAGIHADIQSLDAAALIKAVIVGNTQSSNETNFGFPEPDFNYIFWSSTYTAPVGQLSINFAHTHLDAIDKTLDGARAQLDAAERQKAYQSVAQMLNDNVTYVWLFRYVLAIVAADKVHGLKTAETNGFASYAAKNWYADLWVDG